MLRNGIPEEIVRALQTVSSAFRAWGSKAKVTRPLRDGETLELRDRTLQVLHRPGPLALGHGLLGRGAPDPDRGRPPDQAHLLQPADQPAARRPRGGHRSGASARRRSSPTSSRCARPASCRPRSCCPGHGEPITDHVALIDERLRVPPPPRGEDLRPDRRAAAHRLRARAGAVRRHRGHAGLPDAVRGAGPRRPAAERRPRARGGARRRRAFRGDLSDRYLSPLVPGSCIT